jgi:hypothetical protein
MRLPLRFYLWVGALGFATTGWALANSWSILPLRVLLIGWCFYTAGLLAARL